MTLNKNDVKELDKFIQEMPVKYGMPLINFFNAIQKRESEVKQPSVVEEPPIVEG